MTDAHETDAPDSAAAGVRAEYFDFRDRTHGVIRLDDLRYRMDGGGYVWVDVDAATAAPEAVIEALPPQLLGDFDLRSLLERADAAGGESASRLTRSERILHIVLAGGSHVDAAAAVERLDVVLATGLMLTIRRGRNAVLAAVRRDYIHDFEQHASTPSFLLYEIFNEQVEQFLSVQGRLEDEVEATRLALCDTVDERALGRLGDVSRRLLTLRARALTCRRVLEELVSRKTTLVSEATLTFLEMMIQSLERLLADIATNREILESALHFSLTVMSHRTNQTMNRLAVVSTIFLPLTFLCGVYGMNFTAIPEMNWRYGYLYFWGVSALITSVLVWLLRRARLL
ncbi:MAG: magnesium transporter CorA family protein [Planctomycetia bacterium]